MASEYYEWNHRFDRYTIIKLSSNGFILCQKALKKRVRNVAPCNNVVTAQGKSSLSLKCLDQQIVINKEKY